MLTLHSPMQISPRLLPALEVAGAWISIEPAGRTHSIASRVPDRLEWHWHIDAKGGLTQSGGELSTGPQHIDDEAGYRAAMGALLSFLMHAAECYRHDSDYEDSSFSTAVVHWAYQNDDELGMAQVELEDSE
jgi:hypothetical protein